MSSDSNSMTSSSSASYGSVMIMIRLSAKGTDGVVERRSANAIECCYA
jgi:hypothetical protein